MTRRAFVRYVKIESKDQTLEPMFFLSDEGEGQSDMRYLGDDGTNNWYQSEVLKVAP